MVNGGQIWPSFRGDAQHRTMGRPCAPENLEIPRCAIAHLRFASRPGMTTSSSILGGKNPIAAGLQADDFAGLELPVPGGVDLDHGLALAARERDLRPLDRAERA